LTSESAAFLSHTLEHVFLQSIHFQPKNVMMMTIMMMTPGLLKTKTKKHDITFSLDLCKLQIVIVCYRRYSTGGFMNLTEFHKLVKDAKLEHAKRLPQAQLDIIFTRVNRGDGRAGCV
jgi:hypothetical protein